MKLDAGLNIWRTCEKVILKENNFLQKQDTLKFDSYNPDVFRESKWKAFLKQDKENVVSAYRVSVAGAIPAFLMSWCPGLGHSGFIG